VSQHKEIVPVLSDKIPAIISAVWTMKIPANSTNYQT
jgi:hypothetical protein